MASQDTARQQTATQQQDGSSVVFSDANLTKLDERQIKRIGLYTQSDLAELNQLITDLHRVFTKESGLVDRQKIFIRLNNETTITQLTTELDFPDTFEPSERRSRLFLSDLARIVIGLAKTLYAIWHDDDLRQFSESLDELEYIAEWTGSADGQYISEFDLARNAYKIQALLDLVTSIFAKQTGTDEDTESEQSQEHQSPTQQTSTATIPTITSSTKNASQDNAGSDGDSDENTSTDDDIDPRTNSTLATEALFISSAAYSYLITQFLESAGLAEASLPPELQQQLSQLNQTLKNKLWDIIERLSPEQRQQLLSHSLRIYLYQKLLLELQKDPTFFTLLTQFYQQYAQLIYEQNGAEVAEERVGQIERYFATLNADTDIDSQELNQVLEKIRSEIRTWKEQLLAQQENEETGEQEPETEQEKQDPDVLLADKDGDGVIEPDELEDYAVTKLASPRVRFSPQQEAQLGSHFTATGFDSQHSRIIQDQSARMLWGTLAELFKDDVEQLNSLPQGIRDQVYNQTLSYIMGLSSDELETLRRSPSSLIRHIKNNSFRILGDSHFQHDYSQYSDTKTATAISRANRVEKETAWAYQQINFELFGAHNITDPTVPDTPELQGVFDDVKSYLNEVVFAYMDQVSTEDLLHLYLHSKDRTAFLQDVRKHLNADQVFVENISLFYNNLIAHYEQTQQFTAKEDLQRSLNLMAQYDGRFFRVRATTPAPQVLLDNSLEKILKTDSKLIFDQSDLTVKSLVLNLGLEDTLSLIQKNRISVLESVFQLPPGTLSDANLEEFRSLLSNYARLQASDLSVVTASAPHSLSGIEAMYPGLRLDKADTSFTKPNQSASSVAASQMASVRTVQTVVQSRGENGDKVVAEATDLSTIKEKRDIIMKIFGADWNTLSQADQAALYLYYDLPFNEQSLKTDINKKLPFIYEYIDFRAKKDYTKILEQLSEEYLRHGKKNFSSVLKADFLEATPSADHQRKINQLVLSIQAYEFSLLAAEEQLAIAQAAGYASAQALLEENAILAQNALSNHPELNQIIQQLQFIDELLPEDLTAQTDVTSNTFLESIRTSQRENDDVRSVAATAEAASPQSKLLGALQNLAGTKAKSETLKKGAATLAAKAGLSAATAGTAAVLMAASTLLQNKKFREFAIYGGTALVSSLLYALSTVGGLLGGLLGGAFGFLAGGPFAALTATGGGILGAYTGAQLFPQQWGGWMGFSPRQAPGLDMLYPENNASITDPSIQGVRAANSNQTAAALNSAQSLSGSGAPAATTGTTATAAAPAAATATGTTAAAAQAAATSGGFFGSFFGMSIGLASPVIALISVTFLTGMTVLVIVGAFLVPIPIRDSNWKGDPSETTQEVENPYLDVEKTASITKIENNTDTSVTYTIRVTPKNNHAIMITEVSDNFRKSTEGGPDLISGVTEGSFPQDPFTEPFEFSYNVMIGAGLVDTRVTNTLIVQFQAIDRNGFIPERTGLVRTSASVAVGDPVEGCWPVTGRIAQLPYNPTYTHGCPRNPQANRYCEDAYDIMAVTGTPIYAPYAGNLCEQPPQPPKVGFGNYVTLTVEMNGNTLLFSFAHLQKDAVPDTSPDTLQCMQVQAGDVIGYVDNTGNSTGSHLHYVISHKTDTGGLNLVDLVPKENGVPKVGDLVTDCHE